MRHNADPFINPEHRARIKAVLALPLLLRAHLIDLGVPGWGYWQQHPECPDCEGTAHEECLDCDDRRSEHDHGNGEWGTHCTCPEGESWPCAEPRCARCSGAGHLPKQWTTDGLSTRPDGTFAWVIKRQGCAEAMFCPYAPSDVLKLVAGDNMLGGGCNTLLGALDLLRRSHGDQAREDVAQAARAETTRIDLTPAQMRRIEVAGFTPGSGSIAAWLVQRAASRFPPVCPYCHSRHPGSC